MPTDLPLPPDLHRDWEADQILRKGAQGVQHHPVPSDGSFTISWEGTGPGLLGPHAMSEQDYVQKLERNLRRLEELRARVRHNSLLATHLDVSIAILRTRLENERRRKENIVPFRPRIP